MLHVFLVLWIYEWLITFTDEYQCIWKRKKTGVTVLFLLNRYTVFVSYLLTPISDWMYISKNSVSSISVKGITLETDSHIPL